MHHKTARVRPCPPATFWPPLSVVLRPFDWPLPAPRHGGCPSSVLGCRARPAAVVVWLSCFYVPVVLFLFRSQCIVLGWVICRFSVLLFSSFFLLLIFYFYFPFPLAPFHPLQLPSYHMRRPPQPRLAPSPLGSPFRPSLPISIAPASSPESLLLAGCPPGSYPRCSSDASNVASVLSVRAGSLFAVYPQTDRCCSPKSLVTRCCPSSPLLYMHWLVSSYSCAPLSSPCLPPHASLFRAVACPTSCYLLVPT